MTPTANPKRPPMPAAPPPLPDVSLWAAIHTQPRAEKVVAEYLAKKRIPHYLPVTLSRRQYGARIRDSWIPLFPGYLFYDRDAVDRKIVYASRKVSKILVPDDPTRLQTDLRNVATALEAKPDLARTEITTPGTPVEIVSGPMMGVRGEMVRRKSETLLVLRVDFIHQGVEVAIDEALVRALSPEEI